MFTLYIGNKNYSSWSMRPWVLMRQAGIPFEEVLLRFDDMAPTSPFKQKIHAVNPTGRVPALVADGLLIWDTLAIAEYLAECCPDKHLWPAASAARARARSVCAEMHSGFQALRGACYMNIEARLPEVGAILMRDRADVRADLQRIDAMWSELLEGSGGPMLFGEFSIADAFFAPVCTRIVTYDLPVSETVRGYVQRVHALPGVAAWIQEALAEQDFVPIDEPYRIGR